MTRMQSRYTLAALLLAAPLAAQEAKNVQYLKGMTPIELLRTMNFMRASLGVHCDYCHVVDKKNGWQWDRDDKETKKRARDMIDMVMTINDQYFKGNRVVSCYSCHQGKQKPVNQPSLPQSPPPFPTVIDKPDLAGAPAPEKILAKYFEATGVKSNEPAIKSLEIQGTMTEWEAPDA